MQVCKSTRVQVCKSTSDLAGVVFITQSPNFLEFMVQVPPEPGKIYCMFAFSSLFLVKSDSMRLVWPSLIRMSVLCSPLPVLFTYGRGIITISPFHFVHSDPSFTCALDYRFQLPKDDYMRDVYGGQLYSDLGDFVTKKQNLTLLWHTDGVQVYKSSSNTMWPVSAIINELPPWKSMT